MNKQKDPKRCYVLYGVALIQEQRNVVYIHCSYKMNSNFWVRDIRTYRYPKYHQYHQMGIRTSLEV